jgi:acyl carrier protein
MSMMSAADDVVDRARMAVARALEMPLEQVPSDAVQGSLVKWDSLGHLSVVMELENEFGVSFSTDEAIGLRSVVDIIKAVKQHLHAH